MEGVEVRTSTCEAMRVQKAYDEEVVYNETLETDCAGGREEVG